MRSSILYTAVFATAAFAAPQRRAQLAERAVVWDVQTVTNTVFVTEGYVPKTTHNVVFYPAPTTTPQPETTAVPVVAAAPAPTTFVTYTPPAPKSVVQPEPAASSSAPVSSSANDGSPLSGGVSILSTCNKYRAKYGLAPFTWSSTLASNAAKTGQMNNGQTENHKLFDGSFGQVITPGLNSAVSGVNLAGFTPFEMGYLSWMCEKSTDSQLSGLCEPMQSAMHMMYSSTGHYDILTSSNYKEIGCSFTQNPSASSSSPYQGLWTCDFAF